MEVKKANELGESVRNQISDVFVGGFMQWLQYFSKDPKKLSQAFAHMFLLEKFYVAVFDGEIAGITACTDGKSPCVRLKTRELIRHMGIIRGTIAGMVLKKEFENHPYPFPIESGRGSVEFVATAEGHRGKGVASAIIRHILDVESYHSYVLEVADTNTPAVRLYRKLGFRELMRVPQKHSKQSGINALVYMSY
ncbi:N-acetyltransferase [Sporolactobacillus sp. STCC-11]|uniref:GNAT family N-acetyltransferase n=1 Tax=Sporolactobacillus caesalpiniae TaxID=3230362 RepID=UPI003397B300